MEDSFSDGQVYFGLGVALVVGFVLGILASGFVIATVLSIF